MINKRSLLLTENGSILERHDNNNINGNDFPELDLFKFICVLSEHKRISIKKLVNMLKVKFGTNLIDDLVILAESLKKNPNPDWCIIPKEEYEEYIKNRKV